MVTYQQLIATKPETLQSHVDGWGGVVDTTGKLKTSAESNVKNKVKYGVWEGKSGSDAAARCNYLEAEMNAAKTESEAIKKTLEWGKAQIAHVRGQLETQIQTVNKDPRLRITDQGVVELCADKLGGILNGPVTNQAAVEAVLEADKQNKNMKRLVAAATNVDAQLAAKLKAAANLDNPNDAKDPRFNAKADKDTHVMTRKELRDK